MIKVILIVVSIVVIIAVVFAFATNVASVSQSLPENRLQKGKFLNSETQYKIGLENVYKITVAYLKDKRKEAVPSKTIPVDLLSETQLAQTAGDLLYRLGHSTILMRLSGEYLLTDPVFSDRASPVQWAGPKRFHPNPIDIDKLPKIRAVIISHDHYDHLDIAAIKQLDNKVEQFIVPLNVGKRLVDWGIDHAKIVELDWSQDVNLGAIRLTATPAQHFSGRSILDGNKTLWASWVIQTDKVRLFFSGDSGYFNGFKEIGERYGPFDIAMVETGAYNELWSDIHMMPAESLQAHIDLNADWMMPIHNGTFDLALHDWYTPFDDISALAAQAQVKLLTPQFGEAVHLADIQETQRWWQAIRPQ
jgi:L-ascorbate metabolism protein UlaG (beta-lactamase superfamily)